MALSISNNGLSLIKKFEGCKLTAYQDSVGVWTIGYGHTEGVAKGQTITQVQADAFLKADCANAEKSVNSYTKYNWNQNQFDALVSFTFNCGSGNLKTLLQNGTRTISQISTMITAYNKAGGKVLQGLVNRRAAEKELFDKPASSSSTSAPTISKVNKPVSYLQTDARWKNYNYSAKGETKTIGSSGCGVTVAAMIIATLKDKNVTPITTAEWSMAHGYKALNQGTYYTYFVPQLNEYGIECKRLNTVNLYGKSSSTAHTEAMNALKNGNWVIACLGPGNWTKSGHFILLYQYENGYIYINDPASTSTARIKNTWDLFARQVKYLWTVDVPKNITPSTPSQSVSTTIKTGKVYNCSKLNIRSTPKVVEGNIIHILNVNDVVEILAKEGIWYKVKTKDNLVGYASNKYITIL